MAKKKSNPIEEFPPHTLKMPHGTLKEAQHKLLHLQNDLTYNNAWKAEIEAEIAKVEAALIPLYEGATVPANKPGRKARYAAELARLKKSVGDKTPSKPPKAPKPDKEAEE